MSVSEDRYLRIKNQWITAQPYQDWGVGTLMVFDRKLRVNVICSLCMITSLLILQFLKSILDLCLFCCLGQSGC